MAVLCRLIKWITKLQRTAGTPRKANCDAGKTSNFFFAEWLPWLLPTRHGSRSSIKPEPRILRDLWLPACPFQQVAQVLHVKVECSNSKASSSIFLAAFATKNPTTLLSAFEFYVAACVYFNRLQRQVVSSPVARRLVYPLRLPICRRKCNRYRVFVCVYLLQVASFTVIKLCPRFA